ncbi:hypothetical protein SEPCBS119000_004128 [Sporothrix epigloea]|uniref:Adhesin domain-containing protein n=1 Tax=Sporothrix epigloea TaxID=1892477 RepID=A0ABP0DUH4_9PEZI
MADKQPLLVAHSEAKELSHLNDHDLSALESHSTASAAAARQRRRQVARRVHLAGLLLLAAGFYTYAVGLPSLASALFRWTGAYPHDHNGSDGFVRTGSTPLEGPLTLPDSLQCVLPEGSSEPFTYPLAQYVLTFDHDHSLSVLQNASRHMVLPDDPSDGDDDDTGKLYWQHVHTTGEVVVRKTVDGKEPSVEVEAVSNDERIRIQVAFDDDAQRLSVVVDERIRVEREHWRGDRGACLVVRVTVWVPAAHLETLRVGAVHLGVRLLEDLDLVVDDAARLTSVAGRIVAAQTLEGSAVGKPGSSRNGKKHCTDVESLLTYRPDYRFEATSLDVVTTSGSIQGPWSLLDRLHIASVSGTVGVAVRVLGEEKDHKDLADLRIETVSGTIGLEEVKDDNGGSAPRPHRLGLFTKSGTIHGSGSFAESGHVNSVSGNVAVALTPRKLAADSSSSSGGGGRAKLDVSTVSGKTVVYLLQEAQNEPIDFLDSSHHAVSGTILLHYPSSWVGDIHMETLSGRLAVEGKGVHVVPDKSPSWPPKIRRKVDAVKESLDGKDSGRQSSLQVDTVSGSVKLIFPE